MQLAYNQIVSQIILDLRIAKLGVATWLRIICTVSWKVELSPIPLYNTLLRESSAQLQANCFKLKLKPFLFF